MIAICAILKDELPFIDEWVNYHIKLGYDHIYLYDNDIISLCKSYIRLENRDRVTVNPIPNIDAIYNQGRIYEKCLRDYGNSYDWITFIDIDEFIVSSDIKGMFNSIPRRYDVVVFGSVFYSDCGNVISSGSVVERFKEPSRIKVYDTKSAVRCKSKGIFSGNAHRFYNRFERECYCTTDGSRFKYWGSSSVTAPFVANTYIKHYCTKSLSEFTEYKFPRLPDTVVKSRLAFERYYFSFNERTKEKIEYIDDYFRTI